MEEKERFKLDLEKMGDQVVSGDLSILEAFEAFQIIESENEEAIIEYLHEKEMQFQASHFEMVGLSKRDQAKVHAECLRNIYPYGIPDSIKKLLTAKEDK